MVNMKRVAVVTSTRAEYGILKPLLERLFADEEIKTDLIVTGTHLLEEYGETYKYIEADGFSISEKILVPMNGRTSRDISFSMSCLLDKFSDYFSVPSNRPDILLVVGDRFEIPAICIAAYNERIPIAHFAGGETTQGALDEAFRHSVTKMSQLHFTTTEEYRNRVIQLGENPDKVFNVGSLMIESILALKEAAREDIESFLGFELTKPYALVTFHPVTLENQTAQQQAEELINALREFSDIDFICTKANADAGGMLINDMLEKEAERSENVHLYSSLGQARYLTLMKNAVCVLGNTSSGIGEAPIFKTPTVNIGDRQKGRVRAASIIDCKPVKEEIVNAVSKACDSGFLASIENMENPYGDGHTSEKIVSVLKRELEKGIDIKKEFYDIR